MKAEFEVTYFLWRARKDKTGLAPVYIRSKQNSKKQIAFNTGVKLHPLKWNKKKNEPKVKPSKLLELESRLKDTYKDLVSQGYEPNLNDLLKHLNDLRKPLDKGIIAWCDDYLKSDHSKGQKKAVRTLKTNIGGKTNKEGKIIIEGFNPGMTFDKLTKPRLKSFFEWLTKKGVANNSQYGRLRALINVANHANIELPHLINYKLGYTNKTGNALKVRLNYQEVKAVMNTDTENELETIAKDVFLLACFSGLRISDMLTIEDGKLHGTHYERIQDKTNEPVFVTLHKYNTELFQKYMTGIPYARQTLSGALKEVLKRSGLTNEVVKKQWVGMNLRETKLKKYEEISFHSGRRFYARILKDLGMNDEIVRDELGHRFKTITDMYAGSPEHRLRMHRVQAAMDNMDKTMEEQKALMQIA